MIHFKFHSSLVTESVNFDGDYISLADLKRLIAKKQGIQKAADVDFTITDASTKEGQSMHARLFSLFHLFSSSQRAFLKRLFDASKPPPSLLPDVSINFLGTVGL